VFRTLLPLALAGTLAVSADAQTIDTRAGTPLPMGSIFGVCSNCFVGIGQTFVAPGAPTGAALRLDDFGFWLHRYTGDPAFRFTARILAGGVGGALLYESAVATGPSSEVPVPYTFTLPGGLGLTPGATYLALLDGRGLNSGLTFVSGTGLSGVPVRNYPDGGFVRILGADDGSLDTNDSEHAFVANFTTAPTAVPEPGVTAVLGAGLLLLGAVAGSRRHAAR
jgi:hypothetical protein